MKRAMWILVVAIAAAQSAGANEPAPWEFERGRDSCAIHHELDGPDGSIGRITLSWRDDGGAGATGAMHRAAPRGSRVTSRFAGSEGDRHYGSGMRMSMFSVGGFAKSRANLLAGRAVELVVETRGKPELLYTTGVKGVKDAIAALDRCIESARQNTQRPAARWTATTSGTMGTQPCSLDVSGVTGIEGVDVGFDSVRTGGVRLTANSSPSYLADGGVLRIDLPGAKEPWTVDVETHVVGDGPRSAVLLSELRRGQAPKMAFTPRGGKAVPISLTFENWNAAHAMFEACTSAAAGPKPTQIVSYTELRHAVDERPDTCELTATYQLHGNGIWLVLTAEGGKAVLKVTHRTLGNGFKLMSMDLRAFGGSRSESAPDATLSLDAARFAAVRRGLVGTGVEFGIAMSRSESYAMTFGGEAGRIETAMFEACVKARLDQ